MRSRFLTAAAMVYRILSVLIILLALVLFISFVCGIRCYIVLTGSMEPEISSGSVVLVNTWTDFSDVEPGDVVAFKSGNARVTHRVVSADGERLVTKGDANNKTDGYVMEESFIGRVFLSIPEIGKAAEILNSFWGKTAAASGAVLYLLIGRLLLRSTEKKGEDHDEEHSQKAG